MNLVIGKSQLSHYFPKEYQKISSRNIDLSYLKSNTWDEVYLTFSEQRIYDANIDYITPNYLYTLQIIDTLLPNSNKIVCYSSCELWNNLSGYVSIETSPDFYPLNNEYTVSKLLLLNKIKELRQINSEYNKVVFIHPFYFNSVYRSNYFLFGKVFDSILNKKKIKLGNVNVYRDMVHASFVVRHSIEHNKDCVVGSGRLFNLREFIRDLFHLNGMEYSEMVEEQPRIHGLGKEKLIMAQTDWEYTYQDLLKDTMEDLTKAKIKMEMYGDDWKSY